VGGGDSRREEDICPDAPRTLLIGETDTLERTDTWSPGAIAARNAIVASESEGVRLHRVGRDVAVAANHRIAYDHSESLNESKGQSAYEKGESEREGVPCGRR
jgi:hypothetical protein